MDSKSAWSRVDRESWRGDRSRTLDGAGMARLLQRTASAAGVGQRSSCGVCELVDHFDMSAARGTRLTGENPRKDEPTAGELQESLRLQLAPESDPE